MNHNNEHVNMHIVTKCLAKNSTDQNYTRGIRKVHFRNIVQSTVHWPRQASRWDNARLATLRFLVSPRKELGDPSPRHKIIRNCC